MTLHWVTGGVKDFNFNRFFNLYIMLLIAILETLCLALNIEGFFLLESINSCTFSTSEASFNIFKNYEAWVEPQYFCL